jgi:hypothetical protein
LVGWGGDWWLVSYLVSPKLLGTMITSGCHDDLFALAVVN